MGGKGGVSIPSQPNLSQTNPQPTSMENSLEGMGNQLFTMTGPLRQMFMEDMGTIMRGPGGGSPWMPGGTSMTGVPNPVAAGTGGTQGTSSESTDTSTGLNSAYNPYLLPAYAPIYQLARTGLESQYNPARENIMSSTPRGGALYENLANLEMQRAQQAGALPASLASPIIQDLYNKAYGIAFNTPQTSIAGLTGAEQGLANRYGSLLGSTASMSNAATSAATQSAAIANQGALGLGSGLGSLLGFGLKSNSKVWGK